MPTAITYDFDDLDQEIQAQEPKWSNRSDYITLRNRAYRRALAEYSDQLVGADDIWIRKDNFGTPITLGAALVSYASNGYIFQVALPSDAIRVAEDTILVVKSATEFDMVPRKAFASIDPTTDLYAFWENEGKINIWSKSDLDATATVAFDYYRAIDATQTPTTTPLDIKYQDFGQIVDATTSFLADYV